MSLVDTVNGEKASNPERPETFIPPSQRKTYDPDVSFEEYQHYAKLTRQQEEEDHKSGEAKPSFLQSVFRRGPAPAPPEHRNSIQSQNTLHSPNGSSSEKAVEADLANGNGKTERRLSRNSGHMVITNDEWQNASRAFRTASWGAGFYLITTGRLK